MLYDALKDFWDLAYALLRHIERPAVPLAVPELRPVTPFAGHVDAVQREVATHEEIDAWLGRMVEMDDQIEELEEQLRQLGVEGVP
jgi:hypothetical protein